MNCGLRIVVFLCIYLVPNVMSMGDAYACLLEQLAELITTHQNVVSVRRWVWPPQTSPQRGKQPCFLFISKRSGTINFGQIPITSKKYWEFSETLIPMHTLPIILWKTNWIGTHHHSHHCHHLLSWRRVKSPRLSATSMTPSSKATFLGASIDWCK